MKIFTTNPYDAGLLALLRASEPARPRVRAGAEHDPGFPVGIFAAIIGAGLLGGAMATYFEHKQKVGWE